MSRITVIGVDPGVNGGIAWISSDGKPCSVKMPETERDILEAFRDIAKEGPCTALLEQVHAMPGQGVTSMFTFGKGYGGLRMALLACDIPFIDVTPQKWQKALGCLSRGDKNVTKSMAQQLFPTIKVTHAIADCLLIAEYGRRNNL